MNVTTSANIFEYKFINHFTAEHFCYGNTKPILSLLQTCAFLPYFQKAYYFFT